MKETNQARMNMIMFGLSSLIMSFLAMIFPPLFLFFPSRFVTQSISLGLGRSMLLFASICLIFGGVMGIKAGLALFIVFGPFIVSMNYCIRQKYKVTGTIMACAIVFLASVTAVLYFTGILASIRSGALFDQFIHTQRAIVDAMELSSLQRSNTLLSMRSGVGIFREFLPSILLLVSLLISYVSLLLTGRKLLLIGRVIIQPNSFIFFRLPDQLVLTALIAAIGFVIATQAFQMDLEILRLNVFFTISALLMVQGASVIYFFLFQTIRSVLLRWLVLGLFLFMPGFQVGLILSGLLDKILNIRQLNQ